MPDCIGLGYQRQSGRTTRLLEHAVGHAELNPGSRVLFIAVSWQIADYTMRMIPADPTRYTIRRVDRSIRYPNGSSIRFVAAQESIEEKARGLRPSLVLMDNEGMLPHKLWQRVADLIDYLDVRTYWTS